MPRLLAIAPWILILVYQLGAKSAGFNLAVMRPLSLCLWIAGAPIISYRRRQS